MSKKKENFPQIDENKDLNPTAQKKVLKEPSKEKNTDVDFIKELYSAVENLWFMSETDAEINVFIGEKAENVSKDTLIKQIKASSDVFIEEKVSEEFFKNLTEIQYWFGEEEKATAKKFSALEKLLEENLKDLKVFKVGQIEIDIYAVGLDSQSFLIGISTKAVET